MLERPSFLPGRESAKCFCSVLFPLFSLLSTCCFVLFSFVGVCQRELVVLFCCPCQRFVGCFTAFDLSVSVYLIRLCCGVVVEALSDFPCHPRP